MTPRAPGFRPLKERALLGLLKSELGYVRVRTNGSHHTLKAPNRPTIQIAFHGKEAGAALVRDILVKQVGLSLDEAREVMDRA